MKTVGRLKYISNTDHDMQKIQISPGKVVNTKGEIPNKKGQQKRWQLTNVIEKIWPNLEDVHYLNFSM